jgi:hypothetical protein
VKRRTKAKPGILFRVPPPYVDNDKLTPRTRKRRWQEWVDTYYLPMEAEYEAYVAQHGYIEKPFHMPDAPFDPSEI